MIQNRDPKMSQNGDPKWGSKMETQNRGLTLIPVPNASSSISSTSPKFRHLTKVRVRVQQQVSSENDASLASNFRKNKDLNNEINGIIITDGNLPLLKKSTVIKFFWTHFLGSHF